MMTHNPGLYVHVPFCRSKCPYCDFYSFTADESFMELYTQALIKNIKMWQSGGFKFATVYFGGGTPSLLGSQRLCRVLDAVDALPGAETTVECNPSDLVENRTEGDFARLAEHGASRISMGLQSAVDPERKKLGRRAGRKEVETALETLRRAGIEHISLDLMLGIPLQTVESVKESVDFCAANGAEHVSAYLLQIERGTPFEKVEKALDLPDEDRCCEMYLTACQRLEQSGIRQYEISNFARPGCESRHNLLYWNCEEYLGVGAAAHSFLNGRRFYYPPSADDFIENAHTVDDGEGGSFEEYAMLRLRLSEGLTEQGVLSRFGFSIPDKMRVHAREYEMKGLLVSDDESIRLNPKGFLVSNTVIADLLA